MKNTKNGRRSFSAGKGLAVFPVVILFVLASLLSACGQDLQDLFENFGGDPENGETVSFNFAYADGTADEVSTTKIWLIFSQEIPGLTKDDLFIDRGETGLEKGTLTPSGNGVYALDVGGIIQKGRVSITMSKNGYIFSGSTKPVDIHFATGGTAGLVTFTAGADGTDDNGVDTSTTTVLYLAFYQDIQDLVAENITLSGLPVTKGTLTKLAGTSVYTLGITGIQAAGDLTVTVAKTGCTISSPSQTVRVHYANPDVDPLVITTVEGLKTFLSNAEGGSTPADPIPVKIKVNLADGTDGWAKILEAIAEKQKYVELDIADCTMPGPEFNPGKTDTGEKYITDLTLPDAAESIIEGGFESGTFRNFANLKTFRAAGVKTVGAFAFDFCLNLTTVSLPAATNIGAFAFSYCWNLTTVSLPAVISFGERPFYICTSLTTVFLPAKPPTMTIIFMFTGALPDTISFGGFSDKITIIVPGEAAVSAYTTAWGVDKVTEARGNVGKYGLDHTAVTIAAAP
jgi:hypothetical protein